MPWYKVVMSSIEVAKGKHSELQKAFEALFMAAGAPKEMALFSSGLAGRDNLEIYFSPGSIEYARILLELYQGQSCERPTEGKKPALLVGHADAREKLL